MPVRRLASVAFLLALAAGCGSADEESSPPRSTEPPAVSPTATGEQDGIDPLAGASTTPVEGISTSNETALVVRVSVGRHEGFDRVVFEFKNRVPGYRVGYVTPPLTEDGSGDRVEVAGNEFVLVRMEPASGFDFEVPEGELVYKGPRRITGQSAGTSVVREVVRTGDFEAVLSWAVGLEDPVAFRVRQLSDPPRLVVDFRNH